MWDRDAVGCDRVISDREPAEEANRNKRRVQLQALSRCAMIEVDRTRPESSLFPRSSPAISLSPSLRTTTTSAQTCLTALPGERTPTPA